MLSFVRILAMAALAVALLASTALAQCPCGTIEYHNNIRASTSLSYIGYWKCYSADDLAIVDQACFVTSNYFAEYPTTFKLYSKVDQNASSNYYTGGSTSTPVSCFNPTNYGGLRQGVYFYATCEYGCEIAWSASGHCKSATDSEKLSCFVGHKCSGSACKLECETEDDCVWTYPASCEDCTCSHDGKIHTGVTGPVNSDVDFLED